MTTSTTYEDLKKSRDALFSGMEKYGEGIEKVVAEAYATHVVAHKDNHGEGLGQAIYTGVSTYVGKEFFPGFMGIATPTDAEKDIIDSTLAKTLGYSAEALDKVYGKKKVVGLGDLEQVLKASHKGVNGLLNNAHSRVIGKLKDADLPRLKGFIKEMGTEVGIDVKGEYLLTLKAAQREYGVVLNLYSSRGKKATQSAYEAMRASAAEEE